MTEILPETQFDSTPPDEDAELSALSRALKLAKSFSLLFVICNRADERDRLMSAVEVRLPDVAIQKLPLQSPVPHLLDVLREQINDPPPAVVFVYGLETWLPAGTEAENSRFVLNLNAARNHFPEVVDCPLVFWLPQHLLTSIAHGAPDFFSVRSGIYLFTMPPEARDGLMRSLTSIPHIEVTGLHFEEQLERISTLKIMLKEYETLPEAQRDLFAEARLLDSLGRAYINLGRYREAEPLLEQALFIRQVSLPQAHPHIATSLNNLAGLYENLGRYAEAEPLYLQALSIDRVALGDTHPDTATNLNNLGELYRTQGRYAEAEPLYKQALSIVSASLPESHPLIAGTLNNLALLYHEQRRYVEAEPLYLQALSIDRVALGDTHPETANDLNNLGELYYTQGRHGEAETLYKRALSIRQAYLPEDHPDIANSLNSLGKLYRAQGRYAEAEPLFKQALAITEKILGIAHRKTQIVIKNYYQLLKEQGREEEAATLLEQFKSEAEPEENQ